MVGVFVRFRYDGEVDRSLVTGIAEGARERFEGMPGLRNKFFTVDDENGEAINFYVWDSIEAAEAFFTEELLERVTGLYGVRPTLEYVDIPVLVDNSR